MKKRQKKTKKQMRRRSATVSGKPGKKQKKSPALCVEIICAGFGGQGIMFMGKLFAQAGLIDGMQVSWIPSYGAEVRGGTAHSMVKISSESIPNPTIARPSLCVVMNKPSLLKFAEKVREGGLLLINKTLIDISPKNKEIRTVRIPITDIAAKLGNPKVANMVAVGASIKKTRMFSIKTILSALSVLLKDKGDDVFSLNKKAFEAGYRTVHS